MHRSRSKKILTSIFTVILMVFGMIFNIIPLQQVKALTSTIDVGTIKTYVEGDSTTISKTRTTSSPQVINNKLAVFWQDSTKSLHTSIVANDGTINTLPNITVSPKTTDNSDTIRCKVLSNGNILVYWYSGSINKGLTDTYFKIIDQSGAEITPATKINSVAAQAADDLNRFTDVCELSNGNLAFVWATNGTNYALRRFRQDGTPVDTAQISITSLAGISDAQYTHRIVANKNGKFMIMLAYYNYNYLGMIFDNDSPTPNKVNGQNAFVISNHGEYGNNIEYLKLLSNGKFLAVYQKVTDSSASDPTATRSVAFRIYNDDGTPYTDEKVIRQIYSWGTIKEPVIINDGFVLQYTFNDMQNPKSYFEYYDNDGNYQQDLSSYWPTLSNTGGLVTPFQDVDGKVSIMVNDTEGGTTNYNTWLLRHDLSTPAVVPISDLVATAGNGQANLSFSAPTGATSVSLEQSTNGTDFTPAAVSEGTLTASSTTATVTGLTKGQKYYFRLVVTGGEKEGTSNVADVTIPTTTPEAPTGVNATAGDGSATVSFTPPSDNGGSSITSYTVTSNPGGYTATGTASPITVTGLQNGTSYTFTVTANNIVGTGAASGASGAVTPVSDIDVGANKLYVENDDSINSDTSWTPFPTILGNELAVFWSDDNGISHNELVSNDGIISSMPNIPISPKTNDNGDNINYKSLSNGNILVYWYAGGSGEGLTDTYFKIVDQNGADIIPSTKINSAPGQLNRFTDVCELSNGNLAFIWDTDGANYALRRFRQDGTPVDAAQLSVTSIAGISGSQYTHRIVANKDGRFMIMLSYYNYNYMGMIFDNDSSTPLQVNGQNAFVISNHGEYGNEILYINVLSNGKYLAVYQKISGGSDTSYRSVAFRIYNEDGTPYTDEKVIRRLNSWGYINPPIILNGGFTLSYTFNDYQNPKSYLEYYNNDGVSQKDLSQYLPQLNDQYRIIVPFLDVDGKISLFVNDKEAGKTDYDTWLLRHTAAAPVAAVTPTITTQPASVSENIGATAEFTVEATTPDGGTLTYKWQKSTNGTTWTDITNATDASYTTPTLAYADNGSQYRCVVTNSKNGTTANVTTDAAILTVNQAIVPIANLAVTAGNGQAHLTFAAPTGAASVTVEQSTNGTDFTSANVSEGVLTGTSTTATVTGLIRGQKYYFRLVVIGGDKAGTSNVADITIPTTVPATPTGVTAIAGNGCAAVSFTAPEDNGGSSITSYTVTSNPGGFTGTGTTSPITVTGLQNDTEYTFTVTATNGIGTGAASDASVAVTPFAPAVAPTISKQPENVSKNIGETATFTSVATTSDNGILTYKWQKSTDGTTWTEITGATTASYTTPTLVYADNGSQYRCVVTNSKNGTTANVTTDAAILTVNQAIVPIADLAVTAGNGQANLTFTAPTGSSSVTVEQSTNGTDFTPANVSEGVLTGTSTTATVTGLSKGQKYYFRLVVIGGDKAGTSNVADIIIPTTVPESPTGVTAIACNGSAVVSFTAPVDNGGNPITSYTVTSNPGGFTGTGTTSPITVAGLQNGTEYTFTVTATNGIGTGEASSASSAVTPFAPAVTPSISTQPASVAKNIGETATFTVEASASDNGILTYKWQKSTDGTTWTDIVGATNASYTTPTLTFDDNGSKYKCVVTNSKNGTTTDATTDTATLTVNPAAVAPTISTQPASVTKNIGEEVTFTVGATALDNGTLTYKWQKSVNGATWEDTLVTTATYTIPTVSYAENGSQYRCIITNSKNATTANTTTDTATLTVNPAAVAPTISTQPASVAKNIGETATFTVGAAASDNGTLTYKWQKSTDGTTWTEIVGATNASYTTPTLTFDDNGSKYKCVVTNSKNGTTTDATTDTATLTVNPAAVEPTINTQPSNVAKNIGETATFTTEATVSDNGALTYKWQKSTDGTTWTDITGATNASYTTPTLTFDDNGSKYKCVVTNSKNGTTTDATTDAATLTVNPAAVTPTISIQPASVTKNIGEEVTFTVVATALDNGTLTYKWQKSVNGATWEDTLATTAAYTIPNVSYAENGSQYRCVVTNSKNGTTMDTTTDVATLTVNPAAVAPTISTQPASVAKNIGETATFTVGASASDNGTLTYKWQKSTDGTTWTEIVGATNASYTTPTLTFDDNGSKYKCVVANSKNGTTTDATTDEAILTVNPAAVAPTISTQPVSVAKNIGETVTFTVGATALDNGTLTYKWQKSVNGATWEDTLVTAATYTIPTVSYVDNGSQYRCIITNSKNATTANTTTDSATLTVNPAAVSPTISTQPVSVAKNIGETVTFTVGASALDNGTLTYKWQKSVNGATWENTTVTTATYTIPNVAYVDNGSQYRCVVTNSKNGTTTDTTTDEATLTVNPAAVVPTISTQPASVTKNIGEEVTFTVGATALDNGTLTYKWQKSVNGATWEDTLVTTSAYTIPTVSYAENGSQYRCVVTNSKNGTTMDTTTDVATLTVNPAAVAPTISTQPASVAKNIGETVTFTVGATALDNGTLTYKWQKSTDGTTWEDTTVTAATYTIPTVSYVDNGSQYRCIITNSKNATTANATTDVGILTVNPAAVTPTISTQPAGVTKNIGETAIFTIGATASDNGTLTYKWQKSVNGATWEDTTVTTATYTIPTVSYVDNGSQYRCIITNSKNGTKAEIISNNALLIVNKPVVVTSPTAPKDSDVPAQSTGVDIIVNGKNQTAATADTTKEGDKTVTTVTVNDAKVEDKLQSEGNNAIVIIPTPASAASSDVITGTLTAQTVKDMEKKDAVLEIQTAGVTYTLPAAQINVDSVSQQIGSQVELKDIKVSVSIAKSSEDTAQIIAETANKNNYQAVIKPVDFQVTATNGDKTVEISKFNSYVERMVAIPDGVDPSKITTGIVLNKDGSFSHVPTTITKIDGRYYARINSLTNSTYSVIYNQKTFSDIQNNWAKDAINDMASRLVINGVGDDAFEPNRDITRAEFASIVVKGLGLMRTGTGKDSYSDVSKSDWYYDAVSIANDYGLINGIGKGKIDPSRSITREEAMAIINRAMTITKLKTDLTDSEVQANLNNFKDSSSISGWAKNYVAACVNNNVVNGNNGNIEPKQNITRAEVAAIVQRLLVKSNLINEYAGK